MDGRRVSSRQVATFVILVFMSMTLSFIELVLFPGVSWLQYDPSGAVVALVALLYGPWQGVAIAVLSWIPHLTTGFLGAAMNIMASASMAVVLGSFCRQNRRVGRVALGCVLAVVASTAVSICLNFVVTPMYLDMPYQGVVELVVPYLLPFNVIKTGLNVGIASIAFFRLRALLGES